MGSGRARMALGLGRARLRTAAEGSARRRAQAPRRRARGAHRCLHLAAASPRSETEPGRRRAHARRPDQQLGKGGLMARYLAYTSPARDHLYPMVPTLMDLRGRGHEIHVRTLASECDALCALGLHAEPIAAEIEAAPLRDFEASTPEQALGNALETFAD